MITAPRPQSCFIAWDPYPNAIYADGAAKAAYTSDLRVVDWGPWPAPNEQYDINVPGGGQEHNSFEEDRDDITNELRDHPEDYPILLPWLEYMLSGEPNQTDPLGNGEPNPEIPFKEYLEKWKKHVVDQEELATNTMAIRRSIGGTPPTSSNGGATDRESRGVFGRRTTPRSSGTSLRKRSSLSTRTATSRRTSSRTEGPCGTRITMTGSAERHPRTRTATLPDGRILRATQEDPTADWVVHVEEGAERRGRWLIALVYGALELEGGEQRDLVKAVVDELSGFDTPAGRRFPCPCCDYLTLTSAPTGTHQLCPVCFWEDDAQQYEHLDQVAGANSVSLRQARENFRAHQASSPASTGSVRAPEPYELPPSDT